MTPWVCELGISCVFIISELNRSMHIHQWILGPLQTTVTLPCQRRCM